MHAAAVSSWMLSVTENVSCPIIHTAVVHIQQDSYHTMPMYVQTTAATNRQGPPRIIIIIVCFVLNGETFTVCKTNHDKEEARREREQTQARTCTDYTSSMKVVVHTYHTTYIHIYVYGTAYTWYAQNAPKCTQPYGVLLAVTAV